MTAMGGRPDGRPGNGWAVAWAFAGQAAMLAGIVAAVGLSRTAHVSEAVSVGSSGMPGAILRVPSPATGAIMIPMTIATDGQAGKDVFPGAPMADFTVTPGADLTFTVTMDIPAGADMTDAALLAAPGSLGDWGVDGSLPVVTDQPITAGTVNTFTVQWDGSTQALTPGSQWTLVLTTAGTDSSAEAPVAEITVSG